MAKGHSGLTSLALQYSYPIFVNVSKAINNLINISKFIFELTCNLLLIYPIIISVCSCIQPDFSKTFVILTSIYFVLNKFAQISNLSFGLLKFDEILNSVAFMKIIKLKHRFNTSYFLFFRRLVWSTPCLLASSKTQNFKVRAFSPFL